MGLGSGLSTATDGVKFIISIIVLLVVIVLAIWIFQAFDGWRLIFEQLGRMFGPK